MALAGAAKTNLLKVRTINAVGGGGDHEQGYGALAGQSQQLHAKIIS